MAIITAMEIVDLVIMIAAVAFIFKNSFMPVFRKDYDPLDELKRGFDWNRVKFAIAVAAPAVVLHEMAHKFVAIISGIDATFHASYLWLAIGVALKAAAAPFIFFVPGYVTHAPSTPAVDLMISLAGPLMNLALWLGAEAYLKWAKPNEQGRVFFLHAMIGINRFLFIFNMIPVFFTDGAHAANSILQLINPSWSWPI